MAAAEGAPGFFREALWFRVLCEMTGIGCRPPEERERAVMATANPFLIEYSGYAPLFICRHGTAVTGVEIHDGDLTPEMTRDLGTWCARTGTAVSLITAAHVRDLRARTEADDFWSYLAARDALNITAVLNAALQLPPRENPPSRPS
jgi:hypothetical protein